jgi:predicted nuclease with TOPRIM domain
MNNDIKADKKSRDNKFKEINKTNISYDEVVKAWEDCNNQRREFQTEIYHLKKENEKLKSIFKKIADSNIGIRNALREI